MSSLRRPLLTLGCSLALLGGVSAQAPAPSPPALGTQEDAAVQRASGAAAPAVLSPEVLQLRSDLERIVQRAHTNATFGVLVVSLDRGDTLFSHNADLPLVPASNMKLFTTAAALYYLGADFRYSTYLLTDGEVEGGTLTGDLILYGTGDPAISARLLGSARAPLRELADALVAAGVRQVDGDLIGDGSYFDDAWLGEGWSPDYRMLSYSAPIGALSFAENVVTITVQPGAAGGPAEIRTTPATTGLGVENRVATVTRGATNVRFAHGENRVVVSGQIARGHGGVTRVVPIVDPGNYAAAAFRSVLEERGITVRGGVRSVHRAEASRATITGRAANGVGGHARVLGVHLSPTLEELTTVTNQISHNLYAEALLKTIGRVALGDGSAAGGARAIAYMLECETAVDQRGLRVVDGSGLSRLNRVTARATVHLLDFMNRSNVWEPFYATLPEAAAPGDLRHSLRNRLGQTPAARNLRAKTGTINTVSSLSGYVRSASGERLAFAIYANDAPLTALAKRAEDAIGIRLATFDRPSVRAPVEAAGSAGEANGTTPAADDAAAASPGAPAPRDEVSAEEERESTAAPRRVHQVRQGETLDAISRRYGTTVAALERANPGLNARRLQVGRRLTIPD